MTDHPLLDATTYHQLYTTTTSILTDLHNLFICQLCHRTLTKPLTLTTCTHTYCTHCLEDYEDSTSGGQQAQCCPDTRCGISYYVKDKRPNGGLVSIISSFLPLYTYVMQHEPAQQPDTAMTPADLLSLYNDVANAVKAEPQPTADDVKSTQYTTSQPPSLSDTFTPMSSPAVIVHSQAIPTVTPQPYKRQRLIEQSTLADGAVEPVLPFAAATSNESELQLTTPSMITSESQLERTFSSEHAQAHRPQIVACFTGVSGQLYEQQTHACTQLNIQVTPTITDTTTHLICNTDSVTDSNGVTKQFAYRTVKYCQAILHGLTIVSTDWLTHCQLHNTIMDAVPFELCGDKTSGVDKPTYAPLRSRAATAKQRQLFAGLTFCVLPAYGSIDPPAGEVQAMLVAGGGAIVPCPHDICQLFGVKHDGGDVHQYDNCVLVTWSDIKRQQINAELKRSVWHVVEQYNMQTVNMIWLFGSICRFELLPVQQYQLRV